MIKKRYIFIPLFVLIIGVLVIGILGYILYLRNSNETEVVFAPTEVGTPKGDKVIKDIGPSGGTLTSPDGKLTLTVQQNALTETLSFSIQPIINKAAGGLGLAYRLEPNGKTFTTPLEISVRYDDHDIDGTVPEALSLAYQDQQGVWHAQKSAKLDQAAKTLSVATTHFTDFAFLARFRLSPVEAKLHPGVSQGIELIECKEPGFLDKILSRSLDCSKSPRGKTSWKLRGPGTIKTGSSTDTGILYTAPDRKPADDIAFVDLTIDFYLWSRETGSTSTTQKTFSAKITILGRSYEASGQDGPTSYSGVVCDMEKPFTVTGTHPLIVHTFKFVPSNATAGTMSYSTGGGGMTISGSGTYTITGADTDSPEIVVNVASTARVPLASSSGSGVAHIHLTPLNTVECSGK